MKFHIAPLSTYIPLFCQAVVKSALVIRDQLGFQPYRDWALCDTWHTVLLKSVQLPNTVEVDSGAIILD